KSLEEKAFDSINLVSETKESDTAVNSMYFSQAIRHAPSSDCEFLCGCFYLRANLHRFYSENLKLAEQDNGYALQFCPDSLLCMPQREQLLYNIDATYNLVSDLLKEDLPQASAPQRESVLELQTVLAPKEIKNDSAQMNSAEDGQVNKDAHLIQMDSR